jgi:hypothetical protein
VDAGEIAIEARWIFVSTYPNTEFEDRQGVFGLWQIFFAHHLRQSCRLQHVITLKMGIFLLQCQLTKNSVIWPEISNFTSALLTQQLSHF